MALDEILRSNVWNDYIFRDAEYFWQTSLLEPVGGMDNFFKGFLRQPSRSGGTIAKLMRPGAKVTAIDVASDKVTLAYKQGGKARTLVADFCISTIPVPVFKTLKTNLPETYMEAARKLPTNAAGKVGWQAERFWETKDQIYGGISWTTDAITQIWYPSSGYLSRKGTLTGAYMYGAAAEQFNAQPVEQAPAHGQGAGRAAARRLFEIRRARRGDRLEQHGVRAHGLGRRGRSVVRSARAGAGSAAGPVPHGRRSAHLLERLAGGRAVERAYGGAVDRPSGAAGDAARLIFIKPALRLERVKKPWRRIGRCLHRYIHQLFPTQTLAMA